MKKQQSGFTMIELIMVIVILGILAAFALPRFADFGGDARRASLEGALGTVKSASAIVHSAALVRDVAGNATATVPLEGASINVVFGYPEASADGIVAAAQLSATDYTIEHEDEVTTVTLGSCSFTYTEADATTAAITSVISGQNANNGC